MTVNELMLRLFQLIELDRSIGEKTVVLCLDDTENFMSEPATDVWFSHVTDHVIIDNC